MLFKICSLLLSFCSLGCKTDTPSKNYRVIISTVPNTLGEEQMINRFITASRNIGWEMKAIVSADQNLKEVQDFNPDFMISLRYDVPPVPNLPSLLYIHQPMFWFTKKDGAFHKENFEHFLNYNAFLQVSPDVTPVVEALKENEKEYLAIDTVFGHPATEFVDNLKIRLCFYGALWEKARKSDFLPLYYSLSEAGYFDAYGPKDSWEKLNLKAYKGYVPMDGHSLQDILTKEGVVLILHSRGHFEQGIPTARIFEAAACSCVIISDRHPFIVKHFGDNVLYIDRDDPQKMFEQINAHMQWILSHPKEAIELARKAHAIFKNNFTLESELRKIGRFYEEKKIRVR